ncbi:hypothetical protein [Viridibacterium curvum]|uniref:Uncharacterized protein n=1 Tax=Viridibacterium curvum TaxID=1101404 RepID=A0ABP9QSH5_9RHOO
MAAKLFVAGLVALSLSASNTFAASSMPITWSEALAGDLLPKVLDPAVNVIVDPASIPQWVERARPDEHKRSSALSFGSSEKDRCIEALASAVGAIVQIARAREYDAVFIQDAMGPGSQPVGTFHCRMGFAKNDIKLLAELIVTPDHARKLAERGAPPLAPRKIRSSVISIPISEGLATSSVQRLLRAHSYKLHWGFQDLPAYTQRFGPDAFEGSARVDKYADARTACLAAFQDTLVRVLDGLDDQKFDAAIRLHSWLGDQRASSDDQFDCTVGGRSVDVRLRGMLVTLKP